MFGYAQDNQIWFGKWEEYSILLKKFLNYLNRYPNLKMFRVKTMAASEPQNDLMEFENQWEKWASVNETSYIRRFSAVCLLTAKYMADVLGKNKVN